MEREEDDGELWREMNDYHGGNACCCLPGEEEARVQRGGEPQLPDDTCGLAALFMQVDPGETGRKMVSGSTDEAADEAASSLGKFTCYQNTH